MFTMGSLFDGSGGFPLAASMCGGVPVWAAEVEPYPIAVTRSRFLNMKHLGSVTDINGAEIEPVDLIAFGSPCQGLSQAGLRKGLEDDRSGLFMEAVRIIKEMRANDKASGRPAHMVRPRLALWENVPGAFSSNGGEDFRTVLQELIKIVEPEAPEVPAPEKNRWPYADIIVGDGWSIAWRVFDAQYWGVPQRRRRIHLIIDFAGLCAKDILFEREGVQGYFEKGRTPWQGAATDAEGSTGADDREIEAAGGGNGRGLAAIEAYGIDHAITTGGNCTAQGPCVYKDIQATLKASGPHAVAYSVPYVLKIQSGCEVGVDVYNKVLTGDKSKTLNSAATDADHVPCVIVPNVCYHNVLDTHILDDQGGQQIGVRSDGKSPTLRAEMHGNVPCVMQAAGFKAGQGVKAHGIGWEEERAPTLASEAGGNSVPSVCVKCFDARGNGDGETMPTLTCDHENRVTDYSAVITQPVNTFQNTGQGWWNESPVGATVRTPCGGDAVKSNLVVEKKQAVRVSYIIRRLTPTECARLQGFPDEWGHPDHKADFSDEEYRFWLEVRNTHAAINGKAVKKYTKEQMLKWYNGLHTDSAEYKMWGNSIALPPALYVMQGIAEVMR